LAYSKGLGAACIALAISISSIAAFAETSATFRFLVKAEDGLQLSISGFGANGKKTFQGMATKHVGLFGKAEYSVLVDKAVVYASFASWCAQDVSKRWVLPAAYGKQPGDALCDRQPHDDGKGTYTLKVQ
jgi:hypothetical protein